MREGPLLGGQRSTCSDKRGGHMTVTAHAQGRAQAVRPARLFFGGLLLAVLAACSTPASFSYRAPADTDAFLQPERGSGYTEKPGWATAKFSVAAANPLATDAGYQVLKAGGSAVDAAIAVQMVLALVEPQSSGIAGGAFLVHFNGRKVEAFDGRETAPAAAGEGLFIGADGKPMPFREAVVGGRSVGTPGAVRMLEMAHRQYGKLPWARLFEPAITLAENGFKVSPRLHALLVPADHLKQDPAALAYFYDTDGKPRPVGHILKNKRPTRMWNFSVGVFLKEALQFVGRC